MVHVMKCDGSHHRASPTRRFIKHFYRLTLSRLESLPQYCFLIILKLRILKNVNEHTEKKREIANA